MADDFDSEMLSSTSSSPTPGSPQTPAGGNGIARNSISAMPELSPPGSHGPATREVAMTGFNENLKDSAPLTSISEKNDEEADDSTSNLPAVLREEPGASWMNKKAEEEAKRALEFVVDKDFSLREFGDPFDDRGVGRWKTK
ncbi:hypothetical protein TMEN_4529 [Trichophyton mentagrophytes]|uniref:Uncharacterized protein n=1 Tax=Trichophyton equinum (strain ATCC MYA-4606 / CBS 127.97) TaxID=559882 RepID=F2Q3B8_TRIEC|nr:hypothetical protein TEQG_07553 [Trichophyton equinum CBS 127.97]GBF62005.1 hypothetical protein TMEN_4529 [Trichophyton mentagrophytes]